MNLFLTILAVHLLGVLALVVGVGWLYFYDKWRCYRDIEYCKTMVVSPGGGMADTPDSKPGDRKVNEGSTPSQGTS